MMTQKEKELIAVFRFGVIFPLLDEKHRQWGDQKRMLNELSEKIWEIPGSQRTECRTRYLFHKMPYIWELRGCKLFMGRGINREGVNLAYFLNPVSIPQKTTFSAASRSLITRQLILIRK
jgi:hypothetical protein